MAVIQNRRGLAIRPGNGAHPQRRPAEAARSARPIGGVRSTGRLAATAVAPRELALALTHITRRKSLGLAQGLDGLVESDFRAARTTWWQFHPGPHARIRPVPRPLADGICLSIRSTGKVEPRNQALRIAIGQRKTQYRQPANATEKPPAGSQEVAAAFLERANSRPSLAAAWSWRGDSSPPVPSVLAKGSPRKRDCPNGNLSSWCWR